MALIDTGTLLASIADAAPCGDDLEYDAAFMELERLARGPAQDRLVGPEQADDGPDFREVRDRALELLTRTRDLRVLSILIKALLRADGLPGFAAGVQLLGASLERYWDSIHPTLSAEDDYNPIMRINALRELCDHREVLGPLRAAPLVALPGIGSYSWKDAALASGELAPLDGDVVPDAGKVDAAFANCDPAALAQTAEAASAALASVRAIEAFVADKVGVSQAISLEPLTDVLQRIDALLQSRVAQRTADRAASELLGNGHDAGAGMAPSLAGRSGLGPITSRADVARALDLICAYYEQNEPSSPVPLLLRRAKRLSGMSFLEIVRDLAPSGAPEVETIRGPQDNE